MTTQKRADNEGSIFFDNKKNRWTASVTLGYDKETGKRIRKVRYRKTKREAMEELKKLREQFGKISYYDGDKLTVSQWLDRWYDVYSKPKLRVSSRRGYKWALGLAKSFIGEIQLPKVTPSDIQHILFNRLKTHYKMAVFFRKIIRAAFRRAVADKLIHDDPTLYLELPPKPPEKPFVQPTAEDWERLLNFDSSRCYYWRTLILTEFMTGMRRAELLGLRWQDVEIRMDKNKYPTGGRLHIRHALILGEKEDGMEKAPLLLSDTKSAAGVRDLVIPADFCQELLRYHAKQSAIKLRSADWVEQDFVFSNEDGGPINPCSWSTHFIRVRKKLGIASTFHQLRHDMACRMKQSRRFDFKDIQAQLGHSNVAITLNYYTHIGEEDKNEVSEWLGSNLSRVLGTGRDDADKKKSS